MSYETSYGGRAAFGGFGYEGLSGTYPVQSVSPGIREVQEELQRLGYMRSGTGIYGADGRFGPRTAASLRTAARYVGWTEDAYTPSDAAERRSGEVTIPDDLIERLKSAVPNPRAPHAGGSDASDDVPAELPTTTPTLTTSAPRDGSGTGWVPAAIIGAGVLAVGGYLIYAQRKKPKRNRRRRRRTSRR